MLQMDADAFEALVTDELDRLPDDMVDGLDNIVFVVEDRPEDGSLDLFGLYDGWALTERDRYGVGELPDRIIVYREPHLAECETESQSDGCRETRLHRTSKCERARERMRARAKGIDPSVAYGGGPSREGWRTLA